jgi:hypothetical protein
MKDTKTISGKKYIKTIEGKKNTKRKPKNRKKRRKKINKQRKKKSEKKESKYKGNRKRERAKEKKTIERNKDKEKGEKYLRHRNDHEIQPVPRVSEERETVYTESSRADFYKGLKRINSSECVPERGEHRQNQAESMPDKSFFLPSLVGRKSQKMGGQTH